MIRKKSGANALYQDDDGRLYRATGQDDLFKMIPDFSRTVKPFMNTMRQSLKQANLEIQGSVVKLSFNHIPGKACGGGVRQKITEFSQKSRKAMLERMARLDYSGRVTFVTLTYKTDVSHSDAKSHLRAFLKRLSRKHPGTQHASVWRMEYQKRGTIHWHIMCFGLPFTAWNTLREDWREITDQPDIKMVRIERIHDPKKARSYVAKYIAKQTDSSPASPLFNYMTNQAVLGNPGRFWGIEGRASLPFAKLIITTITGLFDEAHSFKDYMRIHWHGVNDTDRRGAMIFVDNAYDWLRLWRFCILTSD